MIVRRWRGAAGEFHGRAMPEDLAEVEAWVLEVRNPALVLGSAQRGEIADERTAAARGVEVVRRNSGGGAVLLEPGRCLWMDVLLPRDDGRWEDDVGRSAYWLGEVWAEALRLRGVDARVHHGGLEKTAWGRLVCFGAVGPGEVTVGGRKVVGISQRRTRHGARFQCLVLDAWEPGRLLDLLLMDPEDRARSQAELAERAAGVELNGLEKDVLSRLRN